MGHLQRSIYDAILRNNPALAKHYLQEVYAYSTPMACEFLKQENQKGRVSLGPACELIHCAFPNLTENSRPISLLHPTELPLARRTEFVSLFDTWGEVFALTSILDGRIRLVVDRLVPGKTIKTQGWSIGDAWSLLIQKDSPLAHKLNYYLFERPQYNPGLVFFEPGWEGGEPKIEKMGGASASFLAL